MMQLDSFLDLIYCNDSELWKEWLLPVGKTREWVESGRRLDRADWVSEEVRTEEDPTDTRKANSLHCRSMLSSRRR